MGTITLLPETTKYPITLIGRNAGVCWNSDVSDDKKNYQRGINCIRANHGRTLEFPEVSFVADGYSARVIREWYTHIGCLPTRLQESTRYIGYQNFDYVVPESVKKSFDAYMIYENTMREIREAKAKLDELNIPREDSALLLPLGMTTKIVDKRNLRNLVSISRQRMCSRANWEFREMFGDIMSALRQYSEEWAYICDTLLMPKCEEIGYCPEKDGCGRKAGLKHG